MRVVVGTIILVHGLINPDSWWGRLIFDCADAFNLIVSPPIVEEYLEVMQRPSLTRKYPQVAARNPEVLLDWLTDAEIVQLDDIAAVRRDPGDDKFLATAVAGAVSFIVSEDNDLLTLGEYAGIPIVTAAAFLEILGGDVR